MRVRVLSLLFGALLFLQPGAAAQAGDLAQFNAQVENVNQPYKSALFYLRTGNAGVAALELATAVASWKELRTRFETAPPDAFGRDAGWDGSISSISKAFSEGQKLANAGDAKAARKMLQPIRETLRALRKRNGLRAYADCIFDLNAQMNKLYRYRHNPPELSSLAVRNEVKANAAVYSYILKMCRTEASADLQADPNFISLMDGAKKSAANLVKPVDAENQRGLINVLRELKSFDVIVFLRWG